MLGPTLKVCYTFSAHPMCSEFRLFCRCARRCSYPSSCAPPGCSPGACCPGAQGQGQGPAAGPGGCLSGGSGIRAKSGPSPVAWIRSRPSHDCSCSERCKGSGQNARTTFIRPLHAPRLRNSVIMNGMWRSTMAPRTAGCPTHKH